LLALAFPPETDAEVLAVFPHTAVADAQDSPGLSQCHSTTYVEFNQLALGRARGESVGILLAERMLPRMLWPAGKF